MEEEVQQPTEQASIQVGAPTVAPPAQPTVQVGAAQADVPKATTPEVAASRAMKIRMGLPLETSYDDLVTRISSGYEKEVREQASATLDVRKYLHQQQAFLNAAQQIRRPLNLPEQETLKSMLKVQESDPNTVIEEGYSKIFMDGLRKYAQDHPDSDMARAFQRMPDAVEKVLETGQDLRSKKELIHTILEDFQTAEKERVQNRGFMGATWDLVKEFTGYDAVHKELRLRGLSGDTSAFNGMLGMNLAKQAADHMSLPWDQFKKKTLELRDRLKDNPSEGMAYFSAMLGQSYSERLANNWMAPIAVSGYAGAVADSVLLAGAKKAAVNTVTKDVLPTPAAVAEAVGSTKEAGIKQAAEEITKNTPVTPTDAFRQMHSTLQGGALRITEGAEKNRLLSQEFTNRLLQDRLERIDQFSEAVANQLRTQRTPAIFANQHNLEILSDAYRSRYPGYDNSVMDTKFVTGKLGDINAETYFTRDGVNLFETERSANRLATRIGGGEVRPVGAGYVVVKTVPFDETTQLINNLLIDTNTTTPKFNSVLNVLTNGRWERYKTPEETMSAAQKMNRKFATFGPSNYFQFLKENSQDIFKLKGWFPNSKWKEWKAVMAFAKDHDANNLKFNTVGELTDFYMQKWNRLPDPQEVRASFALKSNYDFMHALNQRRAFIKEHSAGNMTWDITLPDETNPVGANAVGLRNYTLNGKQLPTVPRDDGSMLIVHDDGSTKLLNARNLKGKYAETLDKAVEEGRMRVVKLSRQAEQDRPLKDFPGGKWLTENSKGLVGDARVKWLVTSNAKSRQLDWNSIKVGKVADTDFEHYVVQPIMKRDPVTGNWHYENDRTLMATNSRVEARDIATKFDKIREFMDKKDEAGAKAFLENSGLPQEWSEIKEWFKKGRLNTQAGIVAAPRGMTALEVDRNLASKFKNFKDSSGRKFGFLEDERDPYDMFSVENSGTKANPEYNLVPVDHIDPVTSVYRGLTRAVRGQWIDDYRAFSVMHWMAEASPFMDAKVPVMSNPWYFFHNPVWKKGALEQTPERINNLMTQQLHIKQFLGIQDNATTFLHSAAQKLADSLYEHAGPGAALVPTHMLPYIRDPFQYIRTLTFHMRLGMFNPARFVIHGMNFVNVMGIAGVKYAAPGAKATLLRWYSRINSSPEIMDALDRYAGMLQIPGSSKWLPGQWKEATEGLMRSGYEYAGHEQGMLDSTAYQDFMGGKMDAFLRGSTWFQSTAEREVRTSAWYTSFREFRDARPHGPMTEADWGKVLDRADLLASNMSRASNSMIQRGIFSLPTQFLTYQLRVAEIFMGKRLTMTERARLFTTYATLFGVPGAFSLTGMPAGDFIDKWALEGGYTRGEEKNFPGYRYLNDAVTNGLPAIFLALMSGQGDYAKGNWYNIRERYAGGGMEPIRNALISDRPLWDLITGAAGTTLGNLWKAKDGLTAAIIDGIRGEGKYKLKIDDAVDVFKEVTSFAHGVQLYYALKMGKYFSKNEANLGDVSSGNAIFMYLLGLSPQGVSESFTKEILMKEQKEAQNEGEKRALREYQRAIRAQDGNNPQEAEDHMRRAFAWLTFSDYPREDYGKFFSVAAHGYESMIARVAREFGTKHVPESQKAIRQQQLMNELRNQ